MLKKVFIVLLLIINIFWQNPLPSSAITLKERVNNYPQWEHKIYLPTPEKDLIFPQWFEGTWKVTSILTEQIAPFAPQFTTPGFEQNQVYIDRPISFDVRYITSNFIPKQDNFLPAVVNQKEIIIADRLFNGLSIAQAYIGKENVKNVVVNPNNSTEQITNFRTNNSLISTIIGRQQETISEQEFITSEITRQFFRRPESIYLNFVENITKYNLINPNLIQGEQISAVYLSPQDPDYFIAIDKPVSLYHYFLTLEKKHD
jgi:hypothetical protein